MNVNTAVILLVLIVGCSEPPKRKGNEGFARQDRTNRTSSTVDGTERNVASAKATTLPEPMRVGPDVTAPRAISRGVPTPSNTDPKQCYELGIAIFEAVVDKHGSVRNVKQIGGPENEFTKPIAEATKQWKFEPGRYRGEPVDVIINFTVNHIPRKKVKGPC